MTRVRSLPVPLSPTALCGFTTQVELSWEACERGQMVVGSWTDEKRPLFSGIATESGLTVELLDQNNNVLGTAITDSQGNWSVSPDVALDNDEWQFKVRYTDPAGNSSISSPITLNIDDTVPAAPVITTVIDDYGLDTGIIAHEAVTDDQLPTLQGIGPANGTIILYQNGVEVARIQVDSNGDWSWQPDNPLVFDNYTYFAQSVSQIGVINNSLSNEYIVKVSENIIESFESLNAGSGFTSGTKMSEFTISYTPNIATIIGTGDRGPEFSGKFLTFREGDIDIDIDLDNLAYKMSFSLYGMDGPNYQGYVTFYDQNGLELDKVPIGTGSLIFSYDTKPGELISKATITVRNDMSGFDIDNIQVYKANAADLGGGSGNAFILGGDELNLVADDRVFEFSTVAFESQLDDIHRVSLEEFGDNILLINASDVLTYGNEDLFVQDGYTQLMINGDAEDTVSLDSLLPNGVTTSWNNLGEFTMDGVSYDIYQNTDENVELFIKQGMQVITDY